MQNQRKIFYFFGDVQRKCRREFERIRLMTGVTKHVRDHCTDTAPASSPFLTLLGGAFLSFGPEVFTFCVAFIDASSQEHGVLTILVTKTLNNLLICR